MPSTYSHTPGPWSHGEPDMFGDYTITSVAEEGSPAVAAVVSNLRDGEAVAANAALIAAAPDMLAAAIEAERQMILIADELKEHGLGGNAEAVLDKAAALRIVIHRAAPGA